VLTELSLRACAVPESDTRVRTTVRRDESWKKRGTTWTRSHPSVEGGARVPAGLGPRLTKTNGTSEEDPEAVESAARVVGPAATAVSAEIVSVVVSATVAGSREALCGCAATGCGTAAASSDSTSD
jgi:hypothetical protein